MRRSSRSGFIPPRGGQAGEHRVAAGRRSRVKGAPAPATSSSSAATARHGGLGRSSQTALDGAYGSPVIDAAAPSLYSKRLPGTHVPRWRRRSVRATAKRSAFMRPMK